MKSSLIMASLLFFQVSCSSQDFASKSDSAEPEETPQSDDAEKEYLEDEQASSPQTISGMYLACAEDPLIQNPNADIAGCLLMKDDKRVDFDRLEKMEWYINETQYEPYCKEDPGLWSCLFYLPIKESYSVALRDLQTGEETVTAIGGEVPHIVYDVWKEEGKFGGSATGGSTPEKLETIVDEQIKLGISSQKDIGKACSYQLSESRFLRSENCELALEKRDLILKGECFDNVSFFENIDQLSSGSLCEEKIFENLEAYAVDGGGDIVFKKDETCLSLVSSFQRSDALSLSQCDELNKIGVSPLKFLLPDAFRKPDTPEKDEASSSSSSTSSSSSSDNVDDDDD